MNTNHRISQITELNSKSIWLSAATAAVVGGGAIGLLLGIITAIDAIESDGPSLIVLSTLVAISMIAFGAVAGLAVALLPSAALAAVLDRLRLVRYAPIIGTIIGGLFALVSYQLWLSLDPSDSSALTSSILIAVCGAVGGATGGVVLRRQSDPTILNG